MLKKLTFASLGLLLLATPLISSAGTVCPSLSRGMSGPEVTRLQQFLATQYTGFEQYVTGFFGAKTEAAGTTVPRRGRGIRQQANIRDVAGTKSNRTTPVQSHHARGARESVGVTLLAYREFDDIKTRYDLTSIISC